MTPRLLTSSAAAEYLGISLRHLQELRYHRTIPATKVGRSLRWDVRQLDRYIEENTEAAS